MNSKLQRAVCSYKCMRIMMVINNAGLRGRPPKFDGRPRTASCSILSAGGGGNVTAGTTRSLGDQAVAALSAGAYDSSGPLGFVPYEVRWVTAGCLP